jgi:hypothetical protein
MVINHQRKFLFIHVPKSAGSSLTQALMKIPGSSKGPFSYPHYTPGDYQKHFGDKYNIRNYFIFGVIRNPWARMLSWYSFNQMRYRQRPGRYQDQPAFKEKQFEVPFNEWLLTKSFITTEEYKFNPNPIPAQKRPQLDWLCSGEDPDMVDYIGTVETLTDTLVSVLRQNGILTGREQFSIPKATNATNAGKRYREVYGSEARRWVERYFQKDIEFGRYEFD